MNLRSIAIPLTATAVLTIQIGGNSLSSVSFVLFVAVWLWLLRWEPLSAPDHLAVTALCMLINTVPYIGQPDFASLFLRSLRLWVAFLMITAAMRSRAAFGLEASAVSRAALALQAILFVAVALQALAIATGTASHAFLPWEWFGATAGESDEGGSRRTTLASYWLEFGAEKGLTLGQELLVRPSASYAEPSYVGFVTLSLFALYSSLEPNPRRVLAFLALGIATLAICRTTSGVVLLCIYAAYIHQRLLLDRPLWLIGFAAVALAVLSQAGGERLLQVTDMNAEASGFIRLMKPLLNLRDMLLDGRVIGVPPFAAASYFPDNYQGVEIGAGLDNGLANIFLYFGLLALPILLVLRRSLGPTAFFYFVLACMFNGSAFSFDKAAVVTLTCILANRQRYLPEPAHSTVPSIDAPMPRTGRSIA